MMKSFLTSAMLTTLMLMVVRVSGCTYEDNPLLQDEVTTTTRRPTDAENRMYHAIRMEMIKLRMLRGLGMSKPPEIPRGAPTILKDDDRTSLPLPNYLHMRHLAIPAEPALNQPLRKSSRVIVFGEIGSNSPCLVSKNLQRSYTPVSFKLPSDPSLIQRAVLQFKTGFQPKIRAWVCPCTMPSNANHNASASMSEIRKANINRIDPHADFRMRAAGCQQLPFVAEASLHEIPAKSAKKGWSYVHLRGNWKSLVSGFSDGAEERLLFLLDGKLSITDRIRPSLILEVEKGMHREKNYPLRVKRTSQELDECITSRNNGDVDNSSSCCRTGFWVDFKELGWSDWILSPPGFHFHFCSGRCKKTYNNILTGERNRNIWTCCMPKKTSPLKLVIIAGRSSLNHTFIPDFIVDDCACISRIVQ